MFIIDEVVAMASQEYPSTEALPHMKTDRFDYIIIGGGTSGLVIASRLTEDHSIRVLVIEAGADRRNDPRSFIPGLAAQAYDDPDFDWSFQTTPQVSTIPISAFQA